ncbi:hypothetical protein Patl1_24342 [Pistacia atlantica]|nr:hypothetical protein Patl1_24342 [Pistacia atlantica]
MEEEIIVEVLAIIKEGMDVQVLIDGGSTHNFIQERVARYLNIPIVLSKHFKILSGNVDTLDCEGAVLGVQWLELLGRVIMDDKELHGVSMAWKDCEVTRRTLAAMLT